MNVIIFFLFILCLCVPVNAREKIVFCDVGQGDGSYISLENNIDILIDAGPDNKIVDCLQKHMGKFDKTIELAIISHADKDHFYGFIPVVKKYTISSIIVPSLGNSDKDYLQLLDLLSQGKTKILSLKKNDRFTIGSSQFSFVFPTQKDVTMCKPDKRNKCSYIFYFDIGELSILFTGDTEPMVLKDLLADKLKPVDILKVPHHGSKNGLINPFYKRISPSLNIISDGKNNSYGHPHKEVLKILEESIVLRTDKDGSVVLQFRN